MNPSSLIPSPEPIPGPAGLMIFLENLLFLLHILLVNLVVGGSLITLCSRTGGLAAGVRGKIPLFLPFAINLGVAPLLFMQVVYGHLFYTSSILMAVFWIAIIPLLIVAYYGVYLHARREEQAPRFARALLAMATVIFLYIAFMLVNNLSLMSQPERWTAYFQHRSGTWLNLADPALWPRYFHFLAASVAVASVFMAGMAASRARRGDRAAGAQVIRGLHLFGIVTLVQFAIGCWFLFALPSAVVKGFMGGDLVKSLVLLLGVLAGIGATMSAFRGKFRPTLIQLLVTTVAMIITRDHLRTLYLSPHFQPANLAVQPQYGVMALFLAVLIIGLGAVVYMVRLAFPRAQSNPGGAP
jgi:hypothetical protein